MSCKILYFRVYIYKIYLNTGKLRSKGDEDKHRITSRVFISFISFLPMVYFPSLPPSHGHSSPSFPSVPPSCCCYSCLCLFGWQQLDSCCLGKGGHPLSSRPPSPSPLRDSVGSLGLSLFQAQGFGCPLPDES